MTPAKGNPTGRPLRVQPQCKERCFAVSLELGSQCLDLALPSIPVQANHYCNHVELNNASERKDDIHFIRLNNIAALEQEEFIGRSTSRSCEDDWLHSLCPSLQRAASILIRSFSSRKSSFGLSYLSPGHSKIQFLTLLRDSPQNLVCRREVVVR